ncbi:hypothetical protein NS44R_14740, partial [Mammaliicoccus sciuri]
PGDLAGHRVGQLAMGQPGLFDERSILGHDMRRTGSVVGLRGSGLWPGIAGQGQQQACRQDHIAGRELEDCRDRDDAVGEVRRKLGVGIVVVGKLQREDVRDQLLRIGRQLRRRDEADAALAVDDGLGAGLIDGCDRIERRLVEQDVGAGAAVGLDQHLKFGRRHAARALHVEVDLHQHGGAANAHGGHGRIDLHVAVLGGLAGNEGDGPGDQADQRRVVRSVGIVHHFIQHHPRIRG